MNYTLTTNGDLYSLKCGFCCSCNEVLFSNTSDEYKTDFKTILDAKNDFYVITPIRYTLNDTFGLMVERLHAVVLLI